MSGPAALAKGERLPETPDGVEIAMAELAGDSAPDNPARTLLAKQTQLLNAQVRQLGRQRWRDFIITALGLVLLTGVGTFVWSAALSRTVVVEPFDTPPALAQRGLTPHVVAGTVQDAIVAIQTITAKEALKRNISNAWTDQITVQVPNTGVSISDLDRMLRARLSNETHVAGAVVENPDHTISLTIRATGVPAATFSGRPADFPALTAKAAEYVFGYFEPRLLAQYLLRQGRTDETLAFLQTAYPRAREEQRSDLAGVWATTLSRKGQMVESVAKGRLALDLNLFNWTAAGNLVGVLWDVEGEEGAVKMGRELEQRIRDAPAEKQPIAGEYPLQNYHPLVGDWTGNISGMLATLEASGGKTSLAYGDTVGFIGEIEARRHDWRAARRYLAAAQRGPMTSAMSMAVAGYQLLEARNYRQAALVFERAKQMFDADEDVRFSLPSLPCWLGLAYGLNGQVEQARRLLAGSGRWSDCYNFAAVVEEAAGNRAGADAADHRAKQLAPSLPTPYHYRGLTLLGRGDLKGAAREFAAANARGPRWADPLKAWGDVLGRQGRWSEAKAKYDSAIPFAPNWAELVQARQIATEKAAEQTWWPFD